MARASRGKRTTRWVTVDGGVNGLVNATPEQTSIVTGTSTTVGSTVLRVVGNITCHGTVTDALATEYACGLIVSPGTMDSGDQDPSVSTQLDWLYWRQIGFNNHLHAGAGTWNNQSFELDVRGRRKIAEGEDLWFVETMTGQNGNSYVYLRVLLLNP